MELHAIDIPDDFPVVPLDPERRPRESTATCGDCGLSWDDTVPTEYTPAPSARCPFEAFHREQCAPKHPVEYTDGIDVVEAAWDRFDDLWDQHYAAPHLVSTCLRITIGHDQHDALRSEIRFADGSLLVSTPESPDLGFDPEATVLHDVGHALFACHAGITSPVLDRVIERIPLPQVAVDLEEAAIHAIQAWVAFRLGRDPGPAITNARVSITRADRSAS